MNKQTECDASREFCGLKNPQNLRLLIVDDNENNRAVLQYQVDSWGMKNESAESGRVALEKLRKAHSQGRPFDIAILDMMMPGMDGMELARAIKTDSLLRDTKLLVLTSINYASPDKIREAGISASLNKPARSSQLYNCLIGLGGANLPKRDVEPCKIDGGIKLSSRLLLAEDNPINQEVTRCMLQRLGCDLDTVENGKQALQALSERRYDLILMDCQMPEMDGYTATKLIREKEKQGEFGPRPVRIVALTAHAMAGIQDQCLAAGMDDYLGKPFTLDQLNEVLKRWLDNEKDVEEPGPGEITLEKPSETGPSSASNAQPPPQTLDSNILNGIRSLRTEGMPDVLEKVIGIYMQKSPLLMEDLRQAIDSLDAAAIQFAAHSLKSGNANVGALEMAGLCGRLEQLGRAGRTDGATEIFTRLEMTYPLVLDALKAELDGGNI